MNLNITALPVRELDVGDCAISYRVVGTGKPLLLVMGLGADSSLWTEHVSVYSQSFRCILIDNRGVGRSGKPAGPYSAAMMAGDCARVVRAVTDEPVGVVGLSMGGAIAQELALKNVSLVRCLVLVSTWARCDGYLSEVIDQLRVAHGRLSPEEFAQVIQLRIWSPSYVSEHLGELRAARLEAAMSWVADGAFAAQCAACTSHNSLARLNAIAVPTLITAGREDSFTVLGHAQELQRAIPDSRLDVFPGGHAHHWENLEAFNNLTSAWLRGAYDMENWQVAETVGRASEEGS